MDIYVICEYSKFQIAKFIKNMEQMKLWIDDWWWDYLFIFLNLLHLVTSKKICYIFFGNIPLILQIKKKNHKIPINKKFISKKEIFISQKATFSFFTKKIIGAFIW